MIGSEAGVEEPGVEVVEGVLVVVEGDIEVVGGLLEFVVAVAESQHDALELPHFLRGAAGNVAAGGQDARCHGAESEREHEGDGGGELAHGGPPGGGWPGDVMAAES